jgi:hypothetical protein
MIRNKYNGYGFDGSRLYHDPISLSIAATKAGAASSAAAAAAATKAAAGTAAAQTAGLELAKKAAIQESMKQVGVQAGKTAALEASKKGIIDASMKQAAQQGVAQVGTQAAQQSAVEASKQGIAQGFQKMIPQAADDVAGLATQGAGSSAYFNPATATPIPSYAAPAAPLPPAGGGSPFKPIGDAPSAPELTQSFMPNRPPVDPNLSSQRLGEINAKFPNLRSDLSAQTPQLGDPGTFSRIASDKGVSKLTTSPADELMGMKPTEFPLAPESSLAKGAREALNWMGENKLETGLGLMTVGQYMNQPKYEEDKDKYKSTVDMSDFKPTIASVEPFKPSYEYQKYAAEGGLMKYAVGGPVETMSAQNAVGSNMMYPQAGLQTALYSNPMMQRPESVNVISPGEGPAVGAYTGEQKFASGGLSAAERREYGLRTRGERASRNLSKTYEEMEEERQKEAMKLLGERSDPGIIPRSRTQQFGFNPAITAATEYERLAKKNKVPVAKMPKTSLGDIENYMEVPIEAAGGGIMYNLGGYSDGGRLLKGPGDGVSDSIPAVIGKRQPARLADGEFVIPARIVSELGNGSTEAGARKLYAMMERVQNTRRKSIGKKKVAVNSKADKHLPA